MAEPKTTLLEQDAAIYDYLDALLREIPDAAPIAADPAAGAVPGRDPAATNCRPAATPHSAPAAPLGAAPGPDRAATGRRTPDGPRQAPAGPVGAVSDRDSAATGRRPAEAPNPADERAAATRTPGEPPTWAHPDFQALLFQVGRLSLAVPLVTLQSVVPWDAEKVSAMPRQPRWVHGLMRYRERNVTVIDTEGLVLPADRQPAADGQGVPGHILVVGDGGWGLACRTVGEVIRLRPDEVKWRGAGGQRPWLAGTVLGRLCALMDTGAFADMLEQGAAAGVAATADRRTGHG